MTDDLLYKDAVFYRELLDKTYHIKAGRKGELLELDLYFLKEHFYHLLGLGKLADMPDVARYRNKKAFFNDVLVGKITYDKIKKSNFIKEIETRINDIPRIQEILDNLKHGELVIQYDNKKRSSIKADYLIFKACSDGYIHLFLKLQQGIKCVPCSFFKNIGDGYISRQKRYTIIDVFVNEKYSK